jgi:hypothetical protein
METQFSELLGKTILSINKQEDRIEFICEDELSILKNVFIAYVMHHNQDCCETVCIEDINGDLDDLIGTPVLQAEERISSENPEDFTKNNPDEYQDSFTWTFYHLATIKGYVTIRWYGESNGYYSENVDFYKENYKY